MSAAHKAYNVEHRIKDATETELIATFGISVSPERFAELKADVYMELIKRRWYNKEEEEEDFTSDVRERGDDENDDGNAEQIANDGLRTQRSKSEQNEPTPKQSQSQRTEHRTDPSGEGRPNASVDQMGGPAADDEADGN